MRAFGADVELIHSPDGITPARIPAMVRRADEIAEETGAFWTDHRVAVEPAESAVLSGRPAGVHHIEGGRIGYRPPQLRPEDVDDDVAVPEAEAFARARTAARADGIFSGPSTGANLVAAERIAAPGRRVVTVEVDSGLKYLTGDLYA